MTNSDIADDARRDCAEAYQVVGVLAAMLGLFDDPQVIKALDNLSAASNGDPRPHEDLLPFLPGRSDMQDATDVGAGDNR